MVVQSLSLANHSAITGCPAWDAPHHLHSLNNTTGCTCTDVFRISITFSFMRIRWSPFCRASLLKIIAVFQWSWSFSIKRSRYQMLTVLQLSAIQSQHTAKHLLAFLTSSTDALDGGLVFLISFRFCTWLTKPSKLSIHVSKTCRWVQMWHWSLISSRWYSRNVYIVQSCLSSSCWTLLHMSSTSLKVLDED